MTNLPLTNLLLTKSIQSINENPVNESVNEFNIVELVNENIMNEPNVGDLIMNIKYTNKKSCIIIELMLKQYQLDMKL